MPVQVEVPPSEWRYVYPLKEIVKYMKAHSRGASRHDVTRWLGIIEDYAMRNLARTATIARIMQDFERRFGFNDDDEKNKVAEMVKRIVDIVYSFKWREPEKLSQFIKTLRNIVLGMFFEYVEPVPLPSKPSKPSKPRSEP